MQGIFGETFVLALSSSVVFCLQICVSDFYQIFKPFIRVPLEMRLIFTVFHQISWLKLEISKNWDTVFWMKEQWLQQHQHLPVTGKTRKTIFNTNSELSQNCTEIVQARNKEFFRTEEVSGNKATLRDISATTNKEEASWQKFVVLSPRYS